MVAFPLSVRVLVDDPREPQDAGTPGLTKPLDAASIP